MSLSSASVAVRGPLILYYLGPFYGSPLSRVVVVVVVVVDVVIVDIDFVARRLRYSYSWLRLILVVVSTVATPGEWQFKIRTGGVPRLALANGPNIFQMLLVGLFRKFLGGIARMPCVDAVCCYRCLNSIVCVCTVHCMCVLSLIHI